MDVFIGENNQLSQPSGFVRLITKDGNIHEGSFNEKL